LLLFLVICCTKVVHELPTTTQWTFDIQWCPRNPSAIATASFDGHINIFSLMGGQRSPSEVKTEQAASDPFAASILAQRQSSSVALKIPPKWMRRPCGASFVFGGKLVSFGQTDGPKQVHISQVVTECELLQRSQNLEDAMKNNMVLEFCQQKIELSDTDREQQLWNFLKVCFSKEPRQNFLSLLGYTTEELDKKFGALVGNGGLPTAGVDAQALAEEIKTLETKDDEEPSDADQASSSFEGSVSAGNDIDEQPAPPEANRKMQLRLLTTQISSHVAAPFSISTDDDVDGLLSKALLMGNFELAVEICLHADRMADALILAVAGGSELFTRTQQIYFRKHKSQVSRLVSAVVQRDWLDIIQYGELENWKELLAALLTYARPEEFPTLCDVLGSRMETESNGELCEHALLCYICAGNVSKLVDCWAGISKQPNAPLSLQDLIEKVMVLTQAVERERRQAPSTTSGILSQKLQQYAILLASQGSLDTALSYLEQAITAQDTQMEWRDRVYHAQAVSSHLPPEFPFEEIDILPEQAPVVHAAIRGDEISYQPQPAVSRFPQQSLVTDPPVPQQPVVSMPSTYQQPVQTNRPMAHGMPGPLPGHLQQHAPPTPPSSLVHAPLSQTSVLSGPTSPPPTKVITPPSHPPAVTGTPFVPSMQQQPPPPPKAIAERSKEPVPPGWHDPPPLKPTTTPTAYVAPAPITAPIVGMPAPIQPPPPSSGQFYVPQQSMQPSQVAPPEQLAPPPAQIRKSPTPPPTKLKEPIPAEHMILVQTLDDLLDRCRRMAVNPTMKRKADEVRKRLDVLFDKLRDKTLTLSTLGSLHQMCEAVQVGDFQSALALHTGLVASSSFNETSGFLPGLKTLLQMSLQLRV
jgi:protein transport protein SEC31